MSRHEELRNSVHDIYTFFNNNETAIVTSIIILVIAYFYFRKKVNFQYLLDFFVISGALLSLYIFIAPHRYDALACFITYVFR